MALATNKQRGVGWHHTQVRNALLARHADGSLCWWCGRGMYRDPAKNWDRKPLEADHTLPRSKGNTHGAADRLLCSTCNRQRGNGDRDHLRPALHGGAYLPPDHPEDRRVMPWPW